MVKFDHRASQPAVFFPDLHAGAKEGAESVQIRYYLGCGGLLDVRSAVPVSRCGGSAECGKELAHQQSEARTRGTDRQHTRRHQVSPAGAANPYSAV